MPYKIGFDIGGTISKYPEHMRALMRALSASEEFEVFVITDMPRETAAPMLASNEVGVDADHLLCGSWSDHGDLCKAVLMEKHGIEIMVDDRPDYIAEGVALGLLLVPRPRVPYYHPSWKKV